MDRGAQISCIAEISSGHALRICVRNERGDRMIGIIDYGMGNLRSVQKAFAYLGFDAQILGSLSEAEKAERLVLPGVGAFQDAMERLRTTHLDEAVLCAARAGKPVLGICLGMQMMFEASEENGLFTGLGLFPGRIQRMEAHGLKIPHMGWNAIETKKCMLFDDIPMTEGPCVYFVHSYCAPEINDWTAATCTYGQTFTAAVCRDNICATQFHPEKSGTVGLEMLRRFATWEGTAC